MYNNIYICNIYIVRTLSTEKSGSRLTDVILLHWCVAAACVCVVGGKSESSTIMYNALGILFYYIFTVNDECVVSFFFLLLLFLYGFLNEPHTALALLGSVTRTAAERSPCDVLLIYNIYNIILVYRRYRRLVFFFFR